MNSKAIVLLALAWNTAPMQKEVPAMIMDLRDSRKVFRCLYWTNVGEAIAQAIIHGSIPFAAPVLCEVRSRNTGQRSGEVHDSGVRLQSVVIVLAVKTAGDTLCDWEKPTPKLFHGLHTACSSKDASAVGPRAAETGFRL